MEKLTTVKQNTLKYSGREKAPREPDIELDGR